jgi:hypothetical protein
MPIVRDWNNPLADYYKLGLTFKEGAGSIITSPFQEDFTLGSPPTWNGDGSVTGNVATNINANNNFGGQFYWGSNDFILILNIKPVKRNVANTDYPIFEWSDNTAGNYIEVWSDRYSNALRISISQKYVKKEIIVTEKTTFRTYAIHYDHAAQTYQLYTNGIAGTLFTNVASSGYGFALGNTNVTVGMGGESHLKHLAFLRKNGSFTAAEVTSIIADQEQVYIETLDIVNDYGLKLTTATETLTVSGIVGNWTGTEYNADGTAVSISGVSSADYVINGTSVRHLRSVEIADDNGAHDIDLNRTQGNPIDLIGSLVATLSGFPVESGYVLEGTEIVGYTSSREFAEWAQTSSNRYYDGAIIEIRLTSITGESQNLLSRNLNSNYIAITGSNTLAIHTDAEVPQTATLPEGVPYTLKMDFTVALEVTISIDDVYFETLTVTQFPSYFYHMLLRRFSYGAGPIQYIKYLRGVDDNHWDFTTGDLDSIPDIVGGFNATLYNNGNSGWEPIVDIQTFTATEYPLLSSMVTAESSASYLTKYLAPNSVGGTISGFANGLVIEDGEFTSNIVLTTTGLTQLNNMNLLDVDATGAAGDVLLENCEVDDVTG